MKPQLIEFTATHAMSRVCQQLQLVSHFKTILQHFTYCTNEQQIMSHPKLFCRSRKCYWYTIHFSYSLQN